jgi:hypothetical protein
MPFLTRNSGHCFFCKSKPLFLIEISIYFSRSLHFITGDEMYDLSWCNFTVNKIASIY